jgi:hypothetical protein
MLLVLLLMFSFAVAVPVASGQRRYRRHNPEAGKKKAAKRIGIGTAIDAAARCLVHFRGWFANHFINSRFVFARVFKLLDVA